MSRLLEERTLSTELARAACRVILDVKVSARKNARQKAFAQGPVTEADLLADRLIREGLAALGDVVVTEETCTTEHMQRAKPGAAQRVWFVDPLDGTADFVAGRADYAVHIGLVENGVPVLGVVAEPETGVVWRAVVGEGCERLDIDGTITQCVVDAAVPARPRIALSVSHPTPFSVELVRDMGGDPIPKGSVGLKAGLLVDGKADAYVTGSRRIKLWDTAAPAALVLAAGGLVHDLEGQPLRYDDHMAHQNGVVFWTPAARVAMEPLLRQSVKTLLQSR